MSTHHLAQFNVARLLAPLDSPRIADFVAALEPINALADRSPGFVWRHQTAEGDSTSVRVFGDDMVIINFSVWESIDSLKDYVYKSDHRTVLRRRREWFEKAAEPYLAMWWTKAGEIPTLEEAVDRLEHLRRHGPGPRAFDFRTTHPPPEALEIRHIRPEEYELLGELTLRAYTAIDGYVPTGEYAASLANVAWRAEAAEVFVAVENGRIVGGITYVPGLGPFAEFDDADAAGIRMLAVDPDVQGRGVGRRLSEACIARARSDGRHLVVLHSTPNMVPAHRLYQKLGFRRAPHRDWIPSPGLQLLGFELELD